MDIKHIHNYIKARSYTKRTMTTNVYKKDRQKTNITTNNSQIGTYIT